MESRLEGHTLYDSNPGLYTRFCAFAFRKKKLIKKIVRQRGRMDNLLLVAYPIKTFYYVLRVGNGMKKSSIRAAFEI